ncbi:carboxylesterase/lipase family protein [Salana multivorans]|nr:carboxylesterase family protein [Salana multivorans]
MRRRGARAEQPDDAGRAGAADPGRHDAPGHPTPPEEDADLLVTTESGVLRGVRLSPPERVPGGVLAWRGIPYAAPVEGALRWLGPRPPVPWEGVRDASRFGPACVQPPGRGIAEEDQSWDCLTLNVARRAETAEGLKPVVVFLHGGSNSGGSASYPLYGGMPFLASDDIVYVTGNYRLGPFGFLDLTELSTPERPIERNLGLRDQLAILRWVQRNIAAFGGDPSRVTLAGQSAGALGVVSLLAMPAAAGLFQAAVAQSPPAACVSSPEAARRRGRWVVEALLAGAGGTDDGGDDAADGGELPDGPGPRIVETVAAGDPGDDAIDVVELLLTIPARRLLEVADAALAREQEEWPGVLSYCSVVADGPGEVLPERPLDVLASGRGHAVPLLVGTTDNEGLVFTKVEKRPPEEMVEALLRATDNAPEPLLDAYPGFPSRRAAAQVIGDFLFWAPTLAVAEGHARIAPTWMYRYDFATPFISAIGLGPTHGTDLMATFGRRNSTLGRRANLLGGGRRLDVVGGAMQSTWLDLAVRGRERWPRFVVDGGEGEPARATLVLSDRARVELDPHASRRRAWRGFRYYD